MNDAAEFRVLTVGWGRALIHKLWNRLDDESAIKFSHVLHPRCVDSDDDAPADRDNVHYVWSSRDVELPQINHALLAALERPGVPTIHTMIMSDRIVSKLSYDIRLRYATFLAERLDQLYAQASPSVVIGGFDALHSGLALAVARARGIPWFAMNFSVIPAGYACFCDRMVPGSRIKLSAPDRIDVIALAKQSLDAFLTGKSQAPAFIAPSTGSIFSEFGRLPRRLGAIGRTLRKARDREFLQLVESRSGQSVLEASRMLLRKRRATKALARFPTVAEPPATPYAFLGLHLQPESSIDVWAAFFSDQMWVIKTMARALPPTHKLLVKMHKSDVSNYTTEQLNQMTAIHGVEIVRPFASARPFIENADLVIGIQGTIGHEAAMLGKSVIMLGDSPVVGFPSVTRIGAIQALPELVREKLAARPPDRQEILSAFAEFLRPFRPASHNDWRGELTAEHIGGYVQLFDDLQMHVSAQRTGVAQ